MSSPDTDIEKQARRHKRVLQGLAAVAVAVVAFIFLAPLSPDDDATAVTPAAADSQ